MSEPGILPQPIPFGKYYLLERINVGGMAEVYKAKAFGVEGFERLLAVKKILSSIAEDESFINMFIDEAKIAGQLNHPNIAQIFDLGKVEGSYFIALEYIGGKDLKTIFERARRIGEKVSIPRICYTMMKVCEGLAHAHSKKDAQGRELNIVHRDVSPQNVLMSYEGEVKIIDFGIAKAQGKTSQTQVGILKGKFSYMSPEQVRGLHVDNRSDIFSLGIVLYEMLTLERLFLGESDFDTLEKIRKVEMSPPSLYNPHIPKELEDIVLKALAKSPDDRFQEAHEFAEALERFMRNQGYYYTNKDLAAYMKESFSADIEFENKKLEYYRSLNLQPLEGHAPSVNGQGISGNGASEGDVPDPREGLSWGEEEMETQIFDREPEEEVSEADIVYAAEDNDSAETLEYGRALETGDLSFDDDPLGKALRDTRAPQPTAQMEAVERRRNSGTVQSSSHSRRSLPIILAVALVVLGAGGALIWAAATGRIGGPTEAVIAVETQPSVVEIWVNDELEYEGATPYELEVEPGPTTFRIKAAGFVPFERSEEIVAGKQYNLIQRLEPVAPEKRELLVKTDPPGATLFVDGEKLDEPSPFTLTALPEGSFELKISKEGFLDETRTVDQLPEEGLDVRLKPKTVALSISSEPSRASYEVFEQSSGDEVASGRTPGKVEDLDATKKYRVEVERSGYDDWSKEVEPEFAPQIEIAASLEKAKKEKPKDDDEPRVAANETEDRRKPTPTAVEPDPPKVEPDPEPEKEKASGTGTISVASRPAARVYIDGQDTGRYTPLLNFKIKAGKHKIKLVNPEFGLDKTYYVDVEDGQNERIINK